MPTSSSTTVTREMAMPANKATAPPPTSPKTINAGPRTAAAMNTIPAVGMGAFAGWTYPPRARFSAAAEAFTSAARSRPQRGQKRASAGIVAEQLLHICVAITGPVDVKNCNMNRPLQSPPRLGIALVLLAAATAAAAERHTVVSIDGRAFYVDGRPTYAGRTLRGMKVEGLLLNARLVQGVFDDDNPATRGNWAYPDGAWDPERNTREFIAAMPAWRDAGLLSFTINLQGGSPRGYSRLNEQVWHNSAINPDGTLRPAYLARLGRILDRAGELGMAPILGVFYFGQVRRMRDEAACVRAVDETVDWILAKGYSHVVVEIANECNNDPYPDVIRPPRAHELIERVKRRSAGRVQSPAGRLLVSTSFTGGVVPSDNVVTACDFVLLHGNGVGRPGAVGAMVDRVRASKAYRGQPVLFNEDDHFDFEKPDNNFLSAVGRYAGWGYFDYRMKGEGFEQGFQSVPVDWTISSARKRAFFGLLKEMTGE